MPSTVANAVQSREVRLPDRVGRTAKVEHVSSPKESDFGLGPMIWDAIVRGHGSVKAAAFTMGNTDPSLLRRQVVDGTIQLRKFFEADEAALCEFAEYVLETFKPARKSKKQIAREQIPQLLALMMTALEDA